MHPRSATTPGKAADVYVLETSSSHALALPRPSQITATSPVGEAGEVHGPQVMFRMQQSRVALLSTWAAAQQLPDDADLPLPLLRDFHKWALSTLPAAGGTVAAAGDTVAPSAQEMD